MSRTIEVVDLTHSPLPEEDSDIELVGVLNRLTRRSKQRKSRTKSTSGTPHTERSQGSSKSRPTTPKSQKKRSPSPDAQPDETASDLFFVDVEPVDSAPQVQAPKRDSTKQDEVRLLLPAHVTVFGDEPIEVIEQAPVDEDAEDYIEYLEYDDSKAKGLVRYFQEEPKAPRVDRTVCKNCGAEGEHKTSACPVLICLTCGARDEHTTRSCPISKTCFTCGMKGHINASCPNRRSARAMGSSRSCERCQASDHKTSECPSWWRLYDYLTPEGQEATLKHRESRKSLKMGEGGEGYVGSAIWCCTCGGSGHWGDDCHMLTRIGETSYTAFSEYNVHSGPFFDPEKEAASSSQAQHRPSDRQQANNDILWDDVGPPGNVGKKGRMKSRAALAKQNQKHELDDADGIDDWFNRAKKQKAEARSSDSRNQDQPRDGGAGPSKLPNQSKFSFKFKTDSGWKVPSEPKAMRSEPKAEPTNLSSRVEGMRVSSPPFGPRSDRDKESQRGTHGKNRDRDHRGWSDRNSGRGNQRKDDGRRRSERDRDSYHRSSGSGNRPKYHGGYTPV